MVLYFAETPPWGSRVKFIADEGFQSYQWFKDKIKLEGRTSHMLEIQTFEVQDAGTYVCRCNEEMIYEGKLNPEWPRYSASDIARTVKGHQYMRNLLCNKHLAFLYTESFFHFHTQLQGIEESKLADMIQKVDEFGDASIWSTNEKGATVRILSLLKTATDFDFKKWSTKRTGNHMDGAVEYKGAAICLLEVKTAMGAGDEHMQALGYLHHCRQSVDKSDLVLASRVSSVAYPCFLLTLRHVVLTVSCAVVYSQDGKDWYSCTILDQARLTDTRALARLLLKLKLGLKSLQKIYEDSPQLYPVPTKYEDDDQVKELQFVERLKEGVFVAKEKGTDASAKRLIVKFSNRRYGAEAQNACSMVHVAPKVLHCKPFDNGFSSYLMIVMEEVKNSVNLEQAFTSDWLQTKAVIKNLRTAREKIPKEIVHGDLRKSNIMIDKDGNVQFVDFDFAGKEGDVTYPLKVNAAGSDPQEKKVGKKIKRDHDSNLMKAHIEALTIA
eukprot:m.179863 g.179863  ORF g.179863 m.179863 type:complete len:496 (+) comp39232_c0_seq11:498-1985(+)